MDQTIPKLGLQKSPEMVKKCQKTLFFEILHEHLCTFFFLEIFSEDKKKNGVFWKHENMEKRFFQNTHYKQKSMLEKNENLRVYLL